MSLVPDYGGTSDSEADNSSSEDKSDTEETQTDDLVEEKPPSSKLPPPDFQVKSISNQNGLQTNSVFKNPFLEAENEEQAVLQKHVKMIDLKNTDIINGKKICWNYRKGRCRFGHNCKFAHDSDVQKTPEQIEAEKVGNQSKGIVVQKTHSYSNVVEEIDENTTGSTTPNAKRKRPGLSQGIIPGKKVMKMYHNQKK